MAERTRRRQVRRAARDDLELVARMRDGDMAAVGELFDRFAGDAADYAERRMALAPDDAREVASEAFERVREATMRGHGPRVSFKAYLYTAVRSVCHDRTARHRWLVLTPDVASVHEPAVPAPDAAWLADRSDLAEAFRSLPDRWQRVLWATEVLGLKPEDLAGELGISANAASALAYRARNALRVAYGASVSAA